MRPAGENMDAYKKNLKKFKNELKPPPELEGKIIALLKEENLINRPMRNKTVYHAIAASLIFLIGIVIGGSIFPNFLKSEQDKSKVVAEESNLDKYALFLYEDETFQPEVPMPDLVSEYGAWARNLAAKGKLDGAEKLSDEMVMLGVLKNESKGLEGFSGYFIIKASSLNEALELTNTHPHLKYNGGISLRPIENLATRN
jgi:hypothetical protein